MPETVSCTIDFGVDDRAQRLEQFLAVLAPVYTEVKKGSNARVDLGKVDALSVAAATVLVGLKEFEWTQGVKIELSRPIGPEALLTELTCSGVGARLFGDPPHSGGERPTFTSQPALFVPCRPELVGPILELMERFTRVDEHLRAAITLAVVELQQNAAAFAKSRIGVVLARYQPATTTRKGARFGEARVVVLDHGISIPASVRVTKPELSELAALKWALGEGNTTAPAAHEGKGFERLSAAVRARGGSMHVFSGSVGASQQGDGAPACRELREPFPGTLVSIAFRVREPS